MSSFFWANHSRFFTLALFLEDICGSLGVELSYSGGKDNWRLSGGEAMDNFLLSVSFTGRIIESRMLFLVY